MIWGRGRGGKIQIQGGSSPILKLEKANSWRRGMGGDEGTPSPKGGAWWVKINITLHSIILLHALKYVYVRGNRITSAIN